MIKKLIRKMVLGTVASAMLPVGAMADNGSTFSTNRTDFRDESIYFMMTTRFYDGDPKNNVLCWDNQKAQEATKDPAWRGDFKGIIDKLDYIKALGFTAIWITPVVQNASGYDYHGYHAMDFSKVDNRYLSRTSQGSSEDVDFQKLIDAAHAKGIKIVLDIVLNHTGNFGEAFLMPEFKRDNNIWNQADINASMIPNYDLLPSDYLDNVNTQYKHRLALMKNTDGQNHDSNNYWHHVANAWNWDDPTRWWGQIAGDCVDLNTENPAVAEYLVKCYGEFIKMGVDGFRIDTSGHISRLTFNKEFIPQFAALGEKYASKRLLAGQKAPSPFYIYGEVCTRANDVTYRGQPNLSAYYYTWASSPSLLGQWNSDASWWSNQEVKEGAAPLGNMLLCTQEDSDQPTSNNHAMVNGAYHAPDYSKSSGFNVIDFPIHYSFNSVGQVFGMATGGDQYYNDATYNVVYVDSHDYCPGPNDGVRFSGGTGQWAENLTWMFFFRGIPCIYYGSEVEFMAGAKIDNGPNGPLSDTGRAYFGQNLEGHVSATDFAEFTANGQVSKTLNHPLAKHVARLNKIRQAVPALRKGQYTTEGCSSSSGWAWKKAYKSGSVDSYACVAQQAGTATFTGIPNGTYVDCVTGDSKTVTGGTLTVACPTNQGNARVYVLNGPGKIGDDSPFVYTTTAASADNSALASDPGATFWYGPKDAIGAAGLSFSPAGGAFTSESQTVTVSPKLASQGWYQINGGNKVTITGTTTFTLGEGDAAGTTYTVNWGATPADGSEEQVGSVTFTKVGVYTPAVSPGEVAVFYETDASYVGIWAWNGSANFTGGVWNSKPNMEYKGLSSTGRNVYKWTYNGAEGTVPTKVIFLPGGTQSADLDYKNHGYYIDGVWAHEVSADPHAVSVALSQGSTTFADRISVTATVSNATAVYTTDGQEPTASSMAFTGSKDFAFTETTTLKVGALRDGKVTDVKTATYTKRAASAQPCAYFVNDKGWSQVYAWVWDGNNMATNYTGGNWPGVICTNTGQKSQEGYDIWKWEYSGQQTLSSNVKIIFNKGQGGTGNQTADLGFVNGGYYNAGGVTTAIAMNWAAIANGRHKVFSIMGQYIATVGSMAEIRSSMPAGIYIVNGKKIIVK